MAAPVLRRKGTSICAGEAAGGDEWSRVGSEPPDGNYAIIRSDSHSLELVADAVGSRTLWYYHDEHVFMCATSQRALVHLLGRLELNLSVIPWLLTTGTLGPSESWDRRLTRLPPGVTIRLDRKSWSLSTRQHSTAEGGAGKGVEGLARTIGHVFDSAVRCGDGWVLPLSGGYDSRALLMLCEKSDLRTVTWGKAGSRDIPGTDAAVARLLADRVGVRNDYFVAEPSNEPLETIVARFVAVGEGRCDHISGYADGFAIWKTLFDEGISGILRGDEGFGWKAAASEKDVRRDIGIPLWEDFANLPSASDLGLAAPELPAVLRRGETESLAGWRDRMYHEFRIPVLLSALSDLKLAYVEVNSPFLSSSVIHHVRTMPDSSRTEKRVFRRFVESISPDIPIADSVSILDRGQLLKTPEFLSLLKQALGSSKASSLFSRELLELVAAGLKEHHGTESAAPTKPRSSWKRLARALPAEVRARFRPERPLFADFNLLAFRIALATRTVSLLEQDARDGAEALD